MRAARRRLAGLGAITLAVLAGGVAVASGNATAAATGCRVDYRVTSEWQGGFGADVTITNLGDPVTGWTLTWAFASGQRVSQAWNATVTQDGTAVSAKDVGYNGTVGTGAGVSFGFNGAWTTANPVPTTFALNGVSCTGATPTATPCPPPSTPPTPTPTPTPTPSTQPPVTVWLAGDSTVANPSSSGACPVGWGNQFGQYLNGNATVVNSAVGGRSIQTWLYDPNVTTTMNAAGECVINPQTYSTRWQAMLNATGGMKAGDYLLIQFGINDGSTTCNRHVGSARYRELLGVMARAAQQRGAYPIFLTPAAAITCSGSTAVGNRGFLTETFDAGRANNVPVIDLHKLSYTLYNTLRLCPNNGDYNSGAVGAFFCADHTHFETAGARQIAGVVATALRNQQLGLAAYLR
ncbi:cellulose binding domain-containing protein [Micromonospora sp. HUAS LYJ1]|uniref:cellulose binding domain-containing protein n=1 Tax=Micromonospora sp. HUAS LYJ1 TaxID=3061626 RepID=UPI002672FCD9|nr:cellulose binding domain-containing protein [Micromonospora sp. HUAS LYJ1]WKU07864.1 cellulose binding domain-containing protein [Micromonospora sp. HUAS LYJ1]